MPSSNRIPDNSKRNWATLKGPAIGNAGDNEPGPPVPSTGDNGLSKFEQVSPVPVATYVQPGQTIKGQVFAERGRSEREVQAAHGVGPNFLPQAESRGIAPADFAGVKANAPNANVSHGNQNPVRSKGKATPPAKEMIDKGLE